MTWKSPVVLRKPMLSIKKEIALFNSLVSTFSGKVNDLELKALACRNIQHRTKDIISKSKTMSSSFYTIDSWILHQKLPTISNLIISNYSLSRTWLSWTPQTQLSQTLCYLELGYLKLPAISNSLLSWTQLSQTLAISNLVILNSLLSRTLLSQTLQYLKLPAILTTVISNSLLSRTRLSKTPRYHELPDITTKSILFNSVISMSGPVILKFPLSWTQLSQIPWYPNPSPLQTLPHHQHQCTKTHHHKKSTSWTQMHTCNMHCT